MDKIDVFIENNFLLTKDNINEKSVGHREYDRSIILIYGHNELTNKVEGYCNTQKYMCEKITDINQINKNNRYGCLLALSNNDADNLMISSVGLKIYCISHVATLCNNKSNLKIYKEFNFDKIILGNNEIDEYFSILKKYIQNTVYSN